MSCEDRQILKRNGNFHSFIALVDGLWVMGWPSAQIDGIRPLHPSHKCVGRAVTLQFVPARPDIAQDKPAGVESPEYEAFEKCGPNEVR
jgi:regulator of RNase E activity RraA